jgi:hypothetical protein
MSDDQDIVEWLQDNGAVENDGRISVPPEWFDKAINEIVRLRELIKRLKP